MSYLLSKTKPVARRQEGSFPTDCYFLSLARYVTRMQRIALDDRGVFYEETAVEVLTIYSCSCQ